MRIVKGSNGRPWHGRYFYKARRIVEIVHELPKTASGKILRRLLSSAEAEAARRAPVEPVSNLPAVG